MQRATFIIACLALFAALGGPSYAAKQLVGPRDIAREAVKSRHISPGAIGPKALSPRVADRIGTVEDGAVTNAKLADDAVNTAKIENHSVGNIDLAQDGINELALATDSVGSLELIPDAVRGGEVQDGGLDGRDVGSASGTFTTDFPPIAASDCQFVQPATPGPLSTDQITVSPEADFDPRIDEIVFYGQSFDTNEFRIVGCNISDQTVDLGTIKFHWTLIDN
jgi:hypothetical protein